MGYRSYKIYGVTHQGVEEYVDTVTSAAEGKAVHNRMLAEARKGGPFDYIRCRDCLGGLRFEFELRTGRKTA